jgi:glycosyltransferase involved in cell wall biosynthesis
LPPARIGIDGFNIAMARGTGIATYGRVLSQCLAALGHPVDVIFGLPIALDASDLLREVLFFDTFGQDTKVRRSRVLGPGWWREVFATPFARPAAIVPITGKVETRGLRHRLPSFDRILNVADLFSLAARHFRRTGRFLTITAPDPPAVMHWTYPLPVSLLGARNVYTIHDMVPLRLPSATLDNKTYHVRLIRGCLRHAARICTVSETSRQDIIALFPEAADQVVNTYQSVVPAPDALAAEDDELRRLLGGVFGLSLRGYFLYFGAVEPKKNIVRLLEAYLASGCQIPLVLVGGRAWKAEREAELIAEHAQIRQIDYVPFDQLSRLIRGARAVVFPSLSEGFGLPMVEAMALGTPVLTSREGALPEVAGQAAFFVDAYDGEDIAAGMRRLEHDDGLCAELSAAGVVQARRFDLGAYQQRLAAFYADVLRLPVSRRNGFS